MRELYFSGIQPTGSLHLGNYLGALKQWVKLQREKDCIFSIVDLHAITIPQDPVELREDIFRVFALYMAAGIDVNRNIVFVQSQIKEHVELSWCLSCITPMGWMNRMTQFKDKVQKNADNATLGLYSYPILMAADILLYRSTHVPVGNDQKQHVELTRDVAQLFNNRFKTDLFPIPEPVIPEVGARVMSLRDGTKKMSKSDDSDMSRINLTDDDDLIRKKIQKAKTDSDPIPSHITELQNRTEPLNLISIFAAIIGCDEQEILNRYSGQNFSNFKKDLADAIINEIAPIRNKYEEIMSDKISLVKLINQSNEKARNIAEFTMQMVKQCMGLYI